LEFPSIGASDQKVIIINRWGNRIYESNLKNFSWDGKDFNGKEAVEGTYFFIISDINKSGFVQLVR
jgi:flagellar hook assembly protein FlgD